jgi:hypothetical protein
MNKIKGLILAVVILMAGGAFASAANGQIVPKTKHVSKKVYHKGGYYTVTTWHHGKRITKKVWYKSNRWGHKIGHKTKEVVMGPSKPKP